jgi:integrase
MLAKPATSMARKRGLYRRKHSRYWWVDLLLPDGQRVCQSTRCVGRAEAEAFVARLKSKSREAREYQEPSAFEWRQAAARYLEECTDKKSLSDDRDHLKKLEPYLRSQPLNAIDMTVLQSFIRARKEKDEVRNATINRALEIVRRILNLAHQDWRWIRAVPKIRMLKEPRRRVRFLRREEAQRLLNAMPAHMKPIVRFALATGCRASEIFGARIESGRSRAQGRVARPHHGATKSGEGRGIPLNTDAIAALQLTLGQHPRW